MKIFLTGATGYIGGSVAKHLTEQGHSVRGLVRRRELAASLEAQGIGAVLGDLSDHGLLEAEARRADAVVNAADSLRGDVVTALLRGLEGSGKALIHSSGIGLVSEDACGDVVSERISSDDEPIVEGGHPMQKALREVEVQVLHAARVGVRGIVLSNAMVYGIGLGLRAESVQVPMLVRAAREVGAVCVVGRGVNRWSNVHVRDMSSLYALALRGAPAGAFYFAEAGEASFEEIAAAIAARLRLGPIRNCSLQQATALWGEIPARYLLGSNSRVRAVRARRELGWAPQCPSLLAWISAELAA
ncbi:NAD-dependent epimerase/dehydratase family protein [Sorangium sp. So ce385]|uniref:NAD-dependent epimerase/dehydratase family protein n=1 Tax=Sorangium sp. So ce385 TaxID=3133308 RepID=UPI003F5BB978